MSKPHPTSFKPPFRPLKPPKQGNPVPKATRVAGRRAGGALRAEQARQQKRRDSRN